MEAAAEQDGSFCVCAENKKAAPSVRAALRWRRGFVPRGEARRGVSGERTAVWTDPIRPDNPFERRTSGFPFCCSAAHSCCLSAQSCGLRHALNKIWSGLACASYSALLFAAFLAMSCTD